MKRGTSRRGIPCLPTALLLSAIGLTGLIVVAGAPPAQAGGYTVQHGVQYGSAGGVNLLADVYIPDGSGPFPGLVVIHGGVFVKGDKSQLTPASEVMAQNGYVAFNINYRLAPRFPFPAGLNDAEAAVTYLRANAARFKVDPNRVGALGGSAGANFAAMLGTLGEGCPTGFRVVAVVAWSGPFDLKAFGTHVLGNYLGSSASTLLAESASPYYQVDPTDAPIFIANGTNEAIPVTQAKEMNTAYAKAGIPHQLLISPQQAHSEHLGAFIYPQTITFLDTYLKAHKGSCGPTTPPPTTSSPPPSPTGGSTGPQAGGSGSGNGSGGSTGLLLALGAVGALAVGGVASWLVHRSRTAVYRR